MMHPAEIVKPCLDLETIKTACRESKLVPRYSSKKNTSLLMYCHKNHGGASELNVKIVDGQPVATCKVCGVIPDFLDRIGLKAEPATKPNVRLRLPRHAG